MGLSEKIMMKRKEAGLSQKELANKVGVSMSTVRRWESGERSPRQSEIEKLVNVFDASIVISQYMDKIEDSSTKIADILGIPSDQNPSHLTATNRLAAAVKTLPQVTDRKAVLFISYYMNEIQDNCTKMADTIADTLGVSIPSHLTGVDRLTAANVSLPEKEEESILIKELVRGDRTPSVIRDTQGDSPTEKNMITVERKDGSKYTLPATSESYDFLERLHEKAEIDPEDKAILGLMKDMTHEEKKAMFDFLSKKESENSAG